MSLLSIRFLILLGLCFPALVSALTLSSPAFVNNGVLANVFAFSSGSQCSGGNQSPPLAISNIPAGTQSLALTVIDIDGGNWEHWKAWNIPASTTSLPVNASASASFNQATNDFGTAGYGGPCPPTPNHHYVFTLYALNTTFATEPSATQLQGALLATATLTGIRSPGDTASASQTVNFVSAPTVAIGGTGNVWATASSGLAVTYSSTTPNVCTISGNTVTGISIGTCTIAANQAGTANYYGATQVTQNIPVTAMVSTGLWWNQNESGWGMSLTQQGSMVFVAWYTYDPTGKPAWLVMSSCPVVGSSCTGDIYDVIGGTQLGVPWNGTSKVVTKVGTGTLTFVDNNTGTFNYLVNGASGTRQITRQVFATGSSQPAIDYSALWWNENESGWGVAITQQYGMIFATIYTYDASGNPIWYVASSCPLSGNGCSGDLYQVVGGSAPTVTWDGANKVVTKVGTVSFAFSDSSLGTMSYTINGLAGAKAISRQLF